MLLLQLPFKSTEPRPRRPVVLGSGSEGSGVVGHAFSHDADQTSLSRRYLHSWLSPFQFRIYGLPVGSIEARVFNCSSERRTLLPSAHKLGLIYWCAIHLLSALLHIGDLVVLLWVQDLRQPVRIRVYYKAIRWPNCLERKFEIAGSGKQKLLLSACSKCQHSGILYIRSQQPFPCEERPSAHEEAEQYAHEGEYRVHVVDANADAVSDSSEGREAVHSGEDMRRHGAHGE